MVAATKARRAQPDNGAGLTVEKIAPDLLGMIVRVDSLREYPRNPNEGDPEGISESLEEFSQYAPLVVQESTRFVVKGNHTLKAARLLGWKYVAANVMALSDEQAKAIVVGDNRHSEKSRRDPFKLAELAEELQNANLLAGTGYSDTEVDTLLADLAKQGDGDSGPEHIEFTAYDESIADGLVLRGRVVLDFPLEAKGEVLAALEDLKLTHPALLWKESEAV